MTYNITADPKEIEKLTFEATKRIRQYSSQELKGKEFCKQMGIKWIGG